MSAPWIQLSPILADGTSFLIVLAVFIGSAILERLKKRTASSNPSPPASKRPGRRVSRQQKTGTPEPEATRTAASWEEELQRLLGVEPPPAPPTPPTVPRRATERPSPPPLATPATAASPPVPPARIESKLAGAQRVATTHLPGLHESAAAYQQASRLQEQVAGRLKQLEERVQHPSTTPEAAHVKPDARKSDAGTWFRDPQFVRQAVIASVILAPPQGMADQ